VQRMGVPSHTTSGKMPRKTLPGAAVCGASTCPCTTARPRSPGSQAPGGQLRTPRLALNSVGDIPTLCLNRVLKVPTAVYPTLTLTSATLSEVARSSRLASTRRNAYRNRPGEIPVSSWNIREKWNLLNMAT